MEEINIKTLLPVGEKLKPLLSKSCISEADLKGILAERGVFIGDNSKQMSIPLLTLSIISPKEFEKLQEFQKTKEDSVKFRTSKIESSTTENLNDIVPLSLIEPQKIVDRFEFGEMNGFCIIEYGFPHYFRKYVKGDAFESRLANIYFGKTSKSQNVKNATRLILEEFEKLYQTQYHLCLKR